MRQSTSRGTSASRRLPAHFEHVRELSFLRVFFVALYVFSFCVGMLHKQSFHETNRNPASRYLVVTRERMRVREPFVNDRKMAAVVHRGGGRTTIRIARLRPRLPQPIRRPSPEPC